MLVLIKDNKKGIVYNTLTSELKECCDKCCVENEIVFVKNKKYRQGKKVTSSGFVYIVTDDPQTINRTRYFKECLGAYASLLKIVEDIQQKVAIKTTTHTKRLIHNLESLNAHSMQELFNIVSENELRDTSVEKRKTVIENRLKEHQASLYRTILRLVKINTSIKMEFSIFNKLLRGQRGAVDKQVHDLKRAFMNVAHNFFEDFREKNIRLNVQETNVKVFIDYEAFQVTFYQILDNAFKYVLRDTDISITFIEAEKNVQIVIRMRSVRIEDEEVDKIFIDQFCGKFAKKLGANGKGIGMFNVQQTLALNNGSCVVKANIDGTCVYSDGIPYESNEFLVSLPIYKK
jgi:signal transduction histidine kinase